MERKVLKPRFTLAEAKAMARDEFHVRCRAIAELNSYDDQNYKVTAENGAVYVLKVHNGVESRDEGLLDAQSQLYERLRRKGVAAPYPVDSVRFVDAPAPPPPADGDAQRSCLKNPWPTATRRSPARLEWVDLLSPKEITPASPRRAPRAHPPRPRRLRPRRAPPRPPLGRPPVPGAASFADGPPLAGHVDKAATCTGPSRTSTPSSRRPQRSCPRDAHGDFNDANVLVGDAHGSTSGDSAHLARQATSPPAWPTSS
ncbi:phosphotransferase-like protein [Aureococcus anophagefferens]|nr:phosphotransferase-like protein [Aureococcus anophagefferens]